MSETTQAEIVGIISGLAVEADDINVERRKRVQVALVLTVASGAFAVQN